MFRLLSNEVRVTVQYQKMFVKICILVVVLVTASESGNESAHKMFAEILKFAYFQLSTKTVVTKAATGRTVVQQANVAEE